MFSGDDQHKICHKCHRNILTNFATVEISYDNPEKGSYKYTNYYHRNCLLQLRSLARKLANIQEFDVNNQHHVEALAWEYFRSLFHGNPFQPIFDHRTMAEIVIYDFEKDIGFPTEMKLRGLPKFITN